MKKTFLLYIIALLVTTGLFQACKKNKDAQQEASFPITDYFVSGTISPKSGTYTSVYLISFKENNKATFTSSSANDLEGTYQIKNDTLTFEVTDPNNYRIAKFGINKNHELTSAYYRALQLEYVATGSLNKIESTNQLAGKTFKGEEFKLGPVSNRKDFYYKFSSNDLSYASGLDVTSITGITRTYQLINNSAFKLKSGSETEIGFLVNKKLTVFRLSGLYYFGTYNQQ